MLNKNIKITHLTCVFPPYKGGIGSVAKKHAELTKKDYQVIITTPNYNDNETQEEEKDNINIFRIKTKFKYGNAGFIKVDKYIKNSDILEIHYPFYFSMVLAIKCAKKNKKKILTFWHMNPKDKGIKGLFFKLYEKIITPWIFKNSDKILVSTKDYFLNSKYKNLFNKFSHKIEALPFSVDVEKFKKRDKDYDLFEKYKLTGKKVLIFVGGLDKAHYFNGLDVIFKALKELDETYKLIIIGNGELKENYKKLAKTLKIDQKIIFTENIENNQLAKHYNLADCLILSAINQGEAFGIVQLEAMASNIPVIVSDLPGVRTVLKNEETGFTFKTKNHQDLVEKIKKLFETEDLLIKFSNAARLRVLENYDDDIISEKLNKIYENLLN